MRIAAGQDILHYPSPTQAGTGIMPFATWVPLVAFVARSQREPKKKWHGRFEALGVKLLYVFTPMLRLVYGGQSKNYKATSLLRKEFVLRYINDRAHPGKPICTRHRTGT